MWNCHGPLRKCRSALPRRDLLQLGGLSMANVFHHLGIDLATTILDRNQRPMPLLDDRNPVRELTTG